jgi:hypothetical protein
MFQQTLYVAVDEFPWIVLNSFVIVHAVNSKQKTKKFPEQFPLYETPCSIIRVISHLRNNGGNLEFIFHKIILIYQYSYNGEILNLAIFRQTRNI